MHALFEHDSVFSAWHLMPSHESFDPSSAGAGEGSAGAGEGWAGAGEGWAGEAPLQHVSLSALVQVIPAHIEFCFATSKVRSPQILPSFTDQH